MFTVAVIDVHTAVTLKKTPSAEPHLFGTKS